MQHTAQESGGELCAIFKLSSFLESKSVSNVCQLIQLLGNEALQSKSVSNVCQLMQLLGNEALQSKSVSNVCQLIQLLENEALQSKSVSNVCQLIQLLGTEAWPLSGLRSWTLGDLRPLYPMTMTTTIFHRHLTNKNVSRRLLSCDS